MENVPSDCTCHMIDLDSSERNTYMGQEVKNISAIVDFSFNLLMGKCCFSFPRLSQLFFTACCLLILLSLIFIFYLLIF